MTSEKQKISRTSGVSLFSHGAVRSNECNASRDIPSRKSLMAGNTFAPDVNRPSNNITMNVNIVW